MSAFPISAPDPIFNCPSCSHYLPPGSLACPDCHTLIYTRHLNSIGQNAQSLESENKLPEAREAWHAALAWLPPDSSQYAAISQRIAQIDQSIRTGDQKKAKWKKRLGPLAPVAVFLTKAKSIFFFLFKLKFLISILAFFGLYWALFGWKFALGFTLSIFIHELGHYIAVRRRGLKAELPLFLPGFGASVRWFGTGRITLADLSAISLAGPLFGLLAAALCFALFFLTHQSVFLALAYIGAAINLINLIPVFGLDGAKATFALNPLQRVLVLVTCIVLYFFISQQPTLSDLGLPWRKYIFLAIAAAMTWRLFTRDVPEQPHTRTFINFLLLLFSLSILLFATQAVANHLFA